MGTPDSNAAKTGGDASPACQRPVRPSTRNYGAAAGFLRAARARPGWGPMLVSAVCCWVSQCNKPMICIGK